MATDNSQASYRPPIAKNRDTAFFWDGMSAGDILIQRCTKCAELRHPPAPLCLKCRCFDWDTQVASGKATLVSFVVMHHPAIPGYDNPNPIGLVELEEGTRLVVGLSGFERAHLKVGLPVQLEVKQLSDDLSLPVGIPA